MRLSSLLAGLALGIGASALVAEEPRVRVAQGVLNGTAANGAILYADIPYAAAPTGALRWKSPVPAKGWAGVRDASKPGPTCPQTDMGWNSWDAAHSGEDCLNLNVWVPAGMQTGKRLPVMVWYHGGGFIGGSGSAPTYNGAALAGNGVIVVTVNYRLGVFGFLAHPELSAESAGGVSGNYGVQDQIAALKWVNANIRRFGGDPKNVTIFGQSAGSISTANLVTIPEARRYFSRAILESGTPFGIGDLQTLKEAEQANAAFGRIGDLRSKPVAEVLASWNAFAGAAPATRKAIPIVDGRIHTRQPADAYRAGAARGVPLLLGSNVREMPPFNRDILMMTARQNLGDDAEKVLAWYESRGSDPKAGDPTTQMMTDMQFRCGTVAAARSVEKAWLYHFQEDFPGRGVPAHSAEVFYVFDSFAVPANKLPPLSETQAALAATMRGYWTNFAKTGDPNGKGLPRWRRFTSGSGEYLNLAAGAVLPAQGLRGEACARLVERWGQGSLR